MADLNHRQVALDATRGAGTAYDQKIKDMGDGTYAPVTAVKSVNYGALSNSVTSAYAASKVIKASAGTLKAVNGFNSKTSAQFIQLHDAAALPADAAVPVSLLYVGPLQNFSFDYGSEGRAFANGIVICNSSTGPTKTIGSADCWFDAQYI